MTRTLTFTGKTGPGDTVTGLVLNRATNMNFDWEGMMLSVQYDNGNGPKTFHGSLTGVTTVTTSFSGSNVSVTVS